MKVTLTDGQVYSLGFKHHYQQEIVVAPINGEIDYRFSELTTIRVPVATECFLRGYSNGEPWTMLRAFTLKHPKDNPNKEISRSIALDRLVAQLVSKEDEALVRQAYEGRKKAKVNADSPGE